MTALLLAAAGCAPGAYFRPPPAPAVDAAVERVAVPRPERLAQKAEATALTEVAAAQDARTQRPTVLAIAPVRLGGQSVGHAVLRRFLARRTVRILDLTRVDELTATLERPGGAQGLTLNGPLLAALWGARLGAASHVLVSLPLRQQAVTRIVPAVDRYDPKGLFLYTAAREKALKRCEALHAQAYGALVSYRKAFEQAEAEWRKDRKWWASLYESLGGYRDYFDGYARARREYESTAAGLDKVVGWCRTVEWRLPAPEALRADDGRAVEASQMQLARAEGSFWILEVPGGRVVWTALLAREARDPEQAVGALLDALVKAVPGSDEPRRPGGRRP